MVDRRTKKQKLQAMAAQNVSPHEAEIARVKLTELKDTEPMRDSSFKMEFRFGPDPGIGVYDFVKNEWVWIRPSGI